MPINIHDWSDLSHASWNSLVLGNGASIALHNGFTYTSLYDVATHLGAIPTSGAVFTALGTQDFEHTLLACWYANLVNNAIGTPSPKISQAYNEVRDALILSVQKTHCLPNAIQTSLNKAATFSAKFDTVVTFNYDLTLYWMMLTYNEAHGNWFKDAFLSGRFDPRWVRLRAPYSATSTTMVFYGHGALMLTRDIYGTENKIIASPGAAGPQTALLNTVTTAWSAGTHVPIFVSEGTSVTSFAQFVEAHIYPQYTIRFCHP